MNAIIYLTTLQDTSFRRMNRTEFKMQDKIHDRI